MRTEKFNKLMKECGSYNPANDEFNLNVIKEVIEGDVSETSWNHFVDCWCLGIEAKKVAEETNTTAPVVYQSCNRVVKAINMYRNELAPVLENSIRWRLMPTNTTFRDLASIKTIVKDKKALQWIKKYSVDIPIEMMDNFDLMKICKTTHGFLWYTTTPDEKDAIPYYGDKFVKDVPTEIGNYLWDVIKDTFPEESLTRTSRMKSEKELFQEFPYNLIHDTSPIDVGIKYPLSKKHAEELVKCVEESISTLTEREATAIHRIYRDNLKRNDVAEELGIGTARLGQVINKALRKLSHPSREKHFKAYTIMMAEGYPYNALAECGKLVDYHIDQEVFEFVLEDILDLDCIESRKRIEDIHTVFSDPEVCNNENPYDNPHRMFYKERVSRLINQYVGALHCSNLHQYTKKLHAEKQHLQKQLDELLKMPGAVEYLDKIKTVKEDPAKILIEELDLSVRSYICLKKAGINTIGELVDLVEEDVNYLVKIRNLGYRSFNEIIDKLLEQGYITKKPSLAL